MSIASDSDVGDGRYTYGRPRQTFLNGKLMVPSWQQCLMSGSWLHNPIDLPQANCGQIRLCDDSLHQLFTNLQLNGHLYPKLTRIIHWTTHTHLINFIPIVVKTYISSYSNLPTKKMHQAAIPSKSLPICTERVNKCSIKQKKHQSLCIPLCLCISLCLSLTPYIRASITVGVYYALGPPLVCLSPTTQPRACELVFPFVAPGDLL